MRFELARWLENHHAIVYLPDLALNPPQSYLFVQDFLIYSCAIIYCFCYLFYTIRTKRDRFLAGPVDGMFGNLAYELYYPYVVSSSNWQLIGSLVWFLLDLRFAYTAIKYTIPPQDRVRTTTRCIACTIACIILFRALGYYFPDDKEQCTAYWTGLMLELPVGWVSIWLLHNRQDTRGQSLEIWFMRLFGVVTAVSVFAWRYINVPQNWEYVASWQSLILWSLTIIPELAFPILYFEAEGKMEKLLQAHKQKEP